MIVLCRWLLYWIGTVSLVSYTVALGCIGMAFQRRRTRLRDRTNFHLNSWHIYHFTRFAASILSNQVQFPLRPATHNYTSQLLASLLLFASTLSVPRLPVSLHTDSTLSFVFAFPSHPRVTFMNSEGSQTSLSIFIANYFLLEVDSRLLRIAF